VTDDLYDDDELFDAAMAQEDADAAAVVREALPDVDRVTPPLAELSHAAARFRAGITTPDGQLVGVIREQMGEIEVPADDVDLYLDAVATLLEPYDDPDWTDDEMAVVATLTQSDLVGAVVELVRAGAGAAADPESLVALANACPEIEGESDPDDDELLEMAFGLLMPAMQALGIVDADWRVTRLGVWALPKALLRLWERPD
jgi:hypothetical protein